MTEENFVSMTNMMPAGAVIPYALGIAPTGYILCDGREISRTSYGKLFSVIGTTFGPGDGSTTFNVPDMTNRCVMGAGGYHTLGVSGGRRYVPIEIANMPSHNHGVTDPGHTHSYTNNRNDQGTDNVFGTETAADEQDLSATTGSSTTGITINNTGGDEPIDITPLHVALWYIIKY